MLPTTTAAAGRPQLRGSRIAAGSRSASSSAAASVRPDSVRSSLSLSASGGSTGTSAERRRCSSRSPSIILVLLKSLLELLDRPVDQHLGRALGAVERARDLAVVHPEREPHDERLAAVVRQARDALQHVLHVFAALHHR